VRRIELLTPRHKCFTSPPIIVFLEVALEKPYNEKCDVYSFAVLFWEMYCMKTPFGAIQNCSIFMQMVVNDNYRPELSKVWPESMKEMVRRSWDKDWQKRPSMSEINSILKKEIADGRGEE
jgi:serine/threonine protein kinase